MKNFIAQFVQMVAKWFSNLFNRIFGDFKYIKFEMEDINMDSFFASPNSTNEFLKALRNRFKVDVLNWNREWAKAVEAIIKEIEDARKAYGEKKLDKKT